MKITELGLPGVFRVVPQQHSDLRGRFYEPFKRDLLADAVGHPLNIEQTNCSVSRRGTIRGIHSTMVPPGQAKLVSCVRGAILDIVVDIRVGSPTFGRYEVNWLDAQSAAAVYMAEGLGHAFLALTDDTCVNYHCSTPYMPEVDLHVNPLDPELALPWGLTEEPVISEKNAKAPTLAEAADRGLLPTWADCQALYEKLRSQR
ncbi:dTDP-4-dehydrorhamnose 3,5-epimerase family protein [Micromonospora auratinigra]|uniref:dTDP-4-dehydrorhamnose 3,5-epimerase n=1 Tax=Micromonospora auratinigra TaxID=261654 RepID=A0A1A8ZG26_9ACTN|nr:dTDP-4-dehydrorhamnose 3,5-epimerase family protein [Micromonospora auratinigra]SBT42828.1 dTDP-4-dehydrorhamnose 3,5-epimerase [Micromonospora auratinigra]